MPRVTINGTCHVFDGSPTILEALQTLGIEIPALCHDKRLAPVGACRLCVVEVRGAARPVTACNTLVSDGMIVETHTPALEAERRLLLELLAERYPPDPVRRFPAKSFHRALLAYGVVARGVSRPELVDDSHPYIHVDMAQCIRCYRCVRICTEVQGQFTWHAWNRGADTRIVPDSGTTLRTSSCVACGACVDSCPTGALEDETVLSRGTPEASTRTTCPYCGVGCELQIGTRDGTIVDVRPVLDAPVSRGHLCSKGRYAFDFVTASDRVTTPLVRRGGAWQRVSWDEATATVASGLRALLTKHGPDAIGVLGSARSTNEESFVVQKFARLVLGTNNVDCCARVCHAPSAAALRAVLGTGAATASYDDIERARTILLCGSNATENHPIVGARIKQASLRGAHLVVVDPRAIELARYADLHLRLRAGSNVALFNAMAHSIVSDGLCDDQFIATRVDGWEEFRTFIAQWTPERAAADCGVEAAAIRHAARLFATAKPAIAFHGLGLTEHVQGTETVMALINLALLTGNLGSPGTGVNPLRGQNNVQGTAQMGCDPRHLTGGIDLGKGAAAFEKAWGAPVPKQRGLDLMEMMDAALEGRLKGLWAIGYDVLLTDPNATSTRQALGALDFLVVQDLFLNETARELATVFLPVASSFEKDGTFMNAERRIQRVRRAIAPPDDAKSDWEIICAVARAMGADFSYRSAEDIWGEIRRVWPAAAGITYERLDRAGLQWPCPTEEHPGTERLHTKTFAIGQRASLRCIEPLPSPEQPTAEFPLILITGRTLYQFNAGTMTGRTRNALLRPSDLLDISPSDANRLGCSAGRQVRVISRYGACTLTLAIDEAMRPGELFASFQTPEAFTNSVTGPHRDRTTHTPEFKRTAVRVEKLDSQL